MGSGMDRKVCVHEYVKEFILGGLGLSGCGSERAKS